MPNERRNGVWLHMDEQDFLNMLYRLDAHLRYERLCRLLATTERPLTMKPLRVRHSVQAYFPGAQAHSHGLHWTYRRYVDRYQLGIVLHTPSRMTDFGAATTFMLVLRWDTRQLCAVPMRDVFREVRARRSQQQPLYVLVRNEDELAEMVLFARVLFDDVYAALVRRAG